PRPGGGKAKRPTTLRANLDGLAFFGERQQFGQPLLRFIHRDLNHGVVPSLQSDSPIDILSLNHRHFFASSFAIAAATCPARAAEPAAVKWTLTGIWISLSRGSAKAYRSSIATFFSSMTRRAAAL